MAKEFRNSFGLRAVIALVLAAFVGIAAHADDWPQWRGPNRDGISKEKGLLKKWPADGPKLLWTLKDGGVGYSAPAVVGDSLYNLGAWDGDGYVYAVDVKSGKRKWAVKLCPVFSWKGNVWNEGPSASPTVDGDLVFALSGNGDLVCVDKSGTEKWRKNLPKEMGGEVNAIGGGPEKLGWGWTWSPLVDGDKLIIVPGGKGGLLAALDKKTGKLIWQSITVKVQASYSSPVVATVGGVKMYVQMTNEGVYGFDPDNGKQLWFFVKPADDVVIPTPVFDKDQVFVSSWKSKGGDLIKLTAAGKAINAAGADNNPKMDNREGGVVIVGGFLFGHFEGSGLACFDLKSLEKPVWSNRRMERGSIIWADDRLYYYNSETGDVLLLEAATTKPAKVDNLVQGKFTPVASTKRKPNGKAWTHPVIADGKLYIRDQELLHCYEIK